VRRGRREPMEPELPSFLTHELGELLLDFVALDFPVNPGNGQGIAMKAKILAAAVVAAVTFGCGTAKAEGVAYFTITSDTQPTITFSLPANPVLDIFHYETGFGFEVDGVPIDANGVGAGTDDFLFLNASIGGGLSDTNYFIYPTDYPGIFAGQLYFGDEATPTFKTGNYPGTYVDSDDESATVLNAEIDLYVTPLPATLPMFAGGLGALSLVFWRRKSKTAEAAA